MRQLSEAASRVAVTGRVPSQATVDVTEYLVYLKEEVVTPGYKKGWGPWAEEVPAKKEEMVHPFLLVDGPGGDLFGKTNLSDRDLAAEAKYRAALIAHA